MSKHTASYSDSGASTESDRSSFGERVTQYRDRIDGCLVDVIPNEDTFPEHLHKAMRYSVLGGGKRVRPLLTYACGEVLNLDPALLDAPAAAVELIHAFSLVHDDLPAMDDDALRRGRPTTHIAFDEATAILAGDALQALAFDILASYPALNDYPKSRISMMRCLASAAGSTGMTGGQAQDLMAEGKSLAPDELQLMHERKTGYLIQAAIMMACDASISLEEEHRQHIHKYADRIGLAFQVCDDILDVESTTETLGKPQGSDLAANKATYPSVLGMAAAKEHLDQLYSASLKALDELPFDTAPLRWMADYITRRNH
ncbi:MAG: polyprenyl synthetase family protein [Gammaproteobacteria bacterium]